MQLKTKRLRLLQPQILIWIALPLLLWWVLWRVPIREVLAVLQGLSLPAILALIVVNTVIVAMFSARWWLILRAQGYRVPLSLLAGYRLASFGVTYTSPGPQLGGEPFQAYLLHRRSRVPGAEAVASVVLEKLVDLLANFSFLLVGIGTILGMGLMSPIIGPQALLVPTGLLTLPGGYLLALRKGRFPLSGLIGWASGRFSGNRLERIARLTQNSEIQIAQFLNESPVAIFKAFLLSVVIWAALIFEFNLALNFLGLRMSLAQAILALTAARIAFLLPIPAGIGTLEASQVLAMQALGFNPAVGISLSLLIRARDILFGGIGLWLGSVLSR